MHRIGLLDRLADRSDRLPTSILSPAQARTREKFRRDLLRASDRTMRLEPFEWGSVDRDTDFNELDALWDGVGR